MKRRRGELQRSREKSEEDEVGELKTIKGALVLLEYPAKSKYMKYKDPKQPIPVRIQDLLDRMTLEEKIGQMVQSIAQLLRLRDPELVKKIGAATALETRATGISYVFAPCIGVCRDPRWGRCYESYSEDPQIVEDMTEIIPRLQGDIPTYSPKGIPFVAGK
ncbi:hypothetical protein V6N13_148213 [Hibiscus sabdariffa]